MSRAFTILVYVAGPAMAIRTISGFAIDLGVYRAGGQAVPESGPLAFLLGNIYVIIFSTTLTIAVVHLFRRDDHWTPGRLDKVHDAPWATLAPSTIGATRSHS